MSQPRLLDLFCGAGGAAMGYHRAGFDVVGVDINPQSRYPFEFHQGDALAYLSEHGREFDAIHASPPCQAYTNAWKINSNEHPDLISVVRTLLICADRPYVIENVPGAPLLVHRTVQLCGAMFGLGTYRHRLFETGGFVLMCPARPEHAARTTKMGRRPQPGEFMHVVGNFSGVARAREAMGIDWMSRDELRESVPPAYTQFIGEQLLTVLTGAAA